MSNQEKQQIPLIEKIQDTYEAYKKTLVLITKSDELNQSILTDRIKKLNTTVEQAEFYVAQNEESICLYTTNQKRLSPLSKTLLKKIIEGDLNYEHPTYHNAIFQDILKTAALDFSFYIVPTKRDNLKHHFDAIVEFSNNERIVFEDPIKNMQEGEIAYIYVAHEKAICLKTRIVEIDFANREYTLELIDFLQQRILLTDLRELGFRNLDLRRPKPIDIDKLSSIFQKHKKRIRENTTMQENTKSTNQDNRYPLNQILYGPPGTGKTYRTINMALKIIADHSSTPQDEKNEILEILKKLEQDPLNKEVQEQARQQAKNKFDKYRDRKQITFVTFHQSYGYEEFVEGIKPDTESQEDINYQVEDGIFKEICKIAENRDTELGESNDGVNLKNLKDIVNTQAKVWKISLDNKIKEHCFEKGQIRIGWGDPDNFWNLANKGSEFNAYFEMEMEVGDFVCVLETRKTIRGIGIVTSGVNKDKECGEEFQRYRTIRWLDKESHNVLPINGNRQLPIGVILPLSRIKPLDLLKLAGVKLKNTPPKPHILIIDEINRGNVSKIFGELITLIEEDKRIDAKEELKVTLPYSGESFGVPQNLYIIGTMNTADRSITALDTALRRRFEFVEMMPKYNLLESQKCGEIELHKMLKAINERIEFLLDREKTIGHTFFIGINSIEKLKKVFQNKVIPLLQEYFYNDYACIQAVLNNNGMIQGDEKSVSDLFPNSKLEIENKTIYSIVLDSDEIWDNPQTYINIYDKK